MGMVNTRSRYLIAHHHPASRSSLFLFFLPRSIRHPSFSFSFLPIGEGDHVCGAKQKSTGRGNTAWHGDKAVGQVVEGEGGKGGVGGEGGGGGGRGRPVLPASSPGTAPKCTGGKDTEAKKAGRQVKGMQ